METWTQAVNFHVKSCKHSGCIVLSLNFISLTPGDQRTQMVGIFVRETCNSYRTIFRVLWVGKNYLAS